MHIKKLMFKKTFFFFYEFVRQLSMELVLGSISYSVELAPTTPLLIHVDSALRASPVVFIVAEATARFGLLDTMVTNGKGGISLRLPSYECHEFCSKHIVN